MSNKLDSFSIESDSVVILKYHDGRSERTPTYKLAQSLSAEDYQKVHDALHLRATYIKKHTPTWLSLVLLGALSIAVAVGSAKAAQWRFVFPDTAKVTASKSVTPESVSATANPAPLVSAVSVSNKIQSPPSETPVFETTKEESHKTIVPNSKPKEAKGAVEPESIQRTISRTLKRVLSSGEK